jgi:hypothetical protein
VGRLADLLATGHINRLVWIDPTFQVGRMGQFYRNVPANTPNHDLIYAMNLCKSFQFKESQAKRRLRLASDTVNMKTQRRVMSDLALDDCHELGYFVDALEDATESLLQASNTHLADRFICIPGIVSNIAVGWGNVGKWRLSIRRADHCQIPTSQWMRLYMPVAVRLLTPCCN